ncbi:MAG TPA: EamA family transporter [candidate division Zixibacteria bacterium]|nr:EamA family transporter [candidate division Zixibacteria bacterium]
MNVRKCTVLVAVALFASIGDTLLSRGMKDVGAISLNHLGELILAVMNPWVICGISLLLCFFVAMSNALSWADLSYVMPATGMGYVVMALAAKFFLHEHISPERWTGIVLITIGVGFVAGGPSQTDRSAEALEPAAESELIFEERQ